MKPEDTVMSWERIRMILQEQDKKEQRDNMFRLEAIAQAQAEISFKAGMKEVVEWFRRNSVIRRPLNSNTPLFRQVGEDNWQAFLESKGIECSSQL